jgi:hypothetical protein
VAEGWTWRTFLLELVVVVLGVLIALALGQAADNLRWGQEVKRARSALQAEMALSNSFLRDRVTVSPCVVANLDRTARLIEEAAKTHQVGRATGVSLILGRRLADSQWQAERAAQTLIHFPRKEAAQFGDYYDQLGDFQNWVEQERAAHWGLAAGLENGPKHVSDFEVAQLRRDLETARRFQFLITQVARIELDVSRGLGVTPAPPEKEFIDQICKPAS